MLPDRILRRVDTSGDCWLWGGALQRNGYGYTTWRRTDGRWGHARVHRLYYEAFVGPIPDGLEIDHVCQVRRCVNPAHLRAVTHAENLTTRNHRGPARRDACRRGHLFDETNTYTDPRGNRSCRACRMEAVRRWRAN